MYELVLTVCSLLHGASCHELAPMQLRENTSVVGCMIASQIEGANWIGTHPNFYITRATCQPAGRFAKI